MIIANPAAANARQDVVDAVAARLHLCLDGVEVAWTAEASEARQLAANFAVRDEGELGLIVAVGGDGTVHEISQGIVSRWPAEEQTGVGPPVVLAVPGGSGNSTCRNLWGPVGWAEVLDRALDPQRSHVRAIDVLHLAEPDVRSVLGASTGFLAAVLVAAQREFGLAGFDRYRAGAARVLSALESQPTSVSVDGTTLYEGPAFLVAVGGGRYRAQTLQFLPSSILDDGLLDVCVIKGIDAPSALEIAVQAPTGDHLRRSDVLYARGRHIEIQRTDGQPLLAEYDGEVWASPGAHVTIDVLPRALRVLAPTEHPAG